MSSDITELSKYLAYILRHHPEEIGLTLEMDGGWALVDDLISKINSESVYFIDKETLDRIVETDDKKRYSYSPDGTRICANQGHSIPGIKVFMVECPPPTLLFHGTGAKYLESIMKQGIKPKSRLYVHLSSDEETAIKVGKRHGDPRVIYISAEQMYKDGFKFYLSANNVWLTEEVPPKYFWFVSERML